MKIIGKLVDAVQTIDGKFRLTFETDDIINVDEIVGGDANHTTNDLEITINRRRRDRSLSSNAYLWSCLNILAQHKHTSKWDEYLNALRHYGVGTYILVKNDPSIIAKTQAMWRESMVYGQPFKYGDKEVVNMLCMYGSSTYSQDEFKTLLDGVVAEIRDAGLQPPPTADMRQALEMWGENHG